MTRLPEEVQLVIRSQKNLNRSGRQAYDHIKNVKKIENISYSSVLRYYKELENANLNRERQYRSYVLGDNTHDVGQLMKILYLENKKHSEQMIVSLLSSRFGIAVSRGIVRELKAMMHLKSMRQRPGWWGFFFTTPRLLIKVPFINATQRMKRFNYVFDLIHTRETFQNWVWSDECIVQLGGNAGWITVEDTHDKDRFQMTKKHPVKVQVWAGITNDGHGPLCFLHQDETLGAEAYQSILEQYLLPFLDGWIGRGAAVFQQDHAPCHTARSTMKRLSDWGVTVSPWSPSSPDLNPIEYVWKDMKDWLRINKKPTNLAELKQSILQYWEHELTRDKCIKYINHVKENVQLVYGCNGGPIIDKWKQHNLSN